MKIGIIKEGKVPPDARVPFVPAQCVQIMQRFPVQVVVQPSEVRCYSDAEYQDAGVTLQHNLSDCDILMGIKETPIAELIPNKTYCIFSHTVKGQSHNMKLLQAILEKNIELIDYELLTDANGTRLIAFGRFAGMVGAHNAIWTYGQRTGLFTLPRMKDCFDYAAAKMHYQKLQLPPVRIVVTGTGRVGQGAVEVLRDMGIREVSPTDFLRQYFMDEAVFTHLSSRHYMARKDGKPFDYNDFYAHPGHYDSAFGAYATCCDIFINGIFWDTRSPLFFTKEEMRQPDFRIRVIADVTCDLAPTSSVPSTLRASTIADPVFGYNPFTESESEPYQPHTIDMMTIDNLPSEMPRDASAYFGAQFIDRILPELLNGHSEVIERATITRHGMLQPRFQYLERYLYH